MLFRSNDDALVASAAGGTLVGGNGGDLLVGQGGNDVLNGGAGNDVLVGNDGADTLNGGAGEDILDAGTLSDWFFDSGDPNVDSGLGEVYVLWSFGADPFATRVAQLTSNVAGSVSPASYLTAGNHVIDDAFSDTVTGSTESDWFFYNYGQDTATDYSVVADLRVNIA